MNIDARQPRISTLSIIYYSGYFCKLSAVMILTRSGDNPEAHPPFIRFGFGRCNVDNASAATTTPYNGDTVSWYDTNDVKNDCDIDTATTVATLRQKQLRQRLDRVLLRQGHRQECLRYQNSKLRSTMPLFWHNCDLRGGLKFYSSRMLRKK
eukprot:1117671_1